MERYSPYAGTTFQVHMAMADVASDQTTPAHHFWMSMGKLAVKIRRDRGSVTRATAQLVEDGFLVIVDKATKMVEKNGKMVEVPNGETREYSLVFKRGMPPLYDADATGGIPRQGGAPGHTPPVVSARKGVVRGATPGRASDTRGARVVHHKQKRTELEPEPTPPTPQGGETRLLPIDELPTREATDIQTVFNAWVEATGRTGRTVLDPKRVRRIRAMLKAGFTVEDLCDAVRGWAHVPHNAGVNETGEKWNDLGLLLRDAGQVERFRDAFRNEKRVVVPKPGQAEPKYC